MARATTASKVKKRAAVPSRVPPARDPMIRVAAALERLAATEERKQRWTEQFAKEMEGKLHDLIAKSVADGSLVATEPTEPTA